MRRSGRPGHQPPLARARLRSREHPARRALGRTTIRQDEFVWVFVISGAVPPAHFVGGYGARSASASRPCISAWRRHAQRRQQTRRDRLEPHLRGRRQLKADIGRAKVVRTAARKRPNAAGETPRRNGRSCTPSLRRLARPDDGAHKANHIQVAYARMPLAPTRRSRQKRQCSRTGPRRSVCGTNHGLA